MQKTQTKKRRSFFGKWVIIAIIIVALALLLAYFFKFFPFGSGEGKDSNNPQTEQTQTKDSKKDGESDIVSISVKAEKIYLQEDEIDLETLKSKLGEYKGKSVVIQLIDKGATLGTYEEVEKILKDMEYPFTKIDQIKK